MKMNMLHSPPMPNIISPHTPKLLQGEDAANLRGTRTGRHKNMGTILFVGGEGRRPIPPHSLYRHQECTTQD